MSQDKQETDVDAHVGNRIRQRRNELRLSQEKLGEHLGVTFQQIQKYEKGSNRIGAGQLLQIAKFLQVDPNFFYAGLEPPAAAGFSEGQANILAGAMDETLEGHELNHAFARIKSKKLRRSVVDLVTAVANSGQPGRPFAKTNEKPK